MTIEVRHLNAWYGPSQALYDVNLTIEAGVTALWHKYVGPQGRIIGIDRFGLSAPFAAAMKELGITAEAVVAAARAI